MSIYPAGVKQLFRDELTVADGKTTVINRPCVVKSISAAPSCSKENSPFVGVVSLVLNVYDGDDIVLIFAGSAAANFLSSNSSIKIPADGLRINSYLALECKEYSSGGATGTENKHANIKIDYQ